MALFEKVKDKATKDKVKTLPGGKFFSNGYPIITEVTLRKADGDETTMQVSAVVSVYFDEADTHTKEGRELAGSVYQQGFVFRLPVEQALSAELFATLYEKIEQFLLTQEETNAAEL